MDQDSLTATMGNLERIYREHGGRLWWAVLAFSGDREVASDAVAEAFAQALRRGEDLSDPLAWIWRVAFRVAAGELKRSRQTVSAGRGSEESYEIPEQVSELMSALAPLSDSISPPVVAEGHVYVTAGQELDAFRIITS